MNQDETYSEMHRCPICRNWYETNEEMGSWVCPCNGAELRINKEKPLDRAIRRIGQDAILGLFVPYRHSVNLEVSNRCRKSRHEVSVSH